MSIRAGATQVVVRIRRGQLGAEVRASQGRARPVARGDVCVQRGKDPVYRGVEDRPSKAAGIFSLRPFCFLPTNDE